MTPPTVSIGMPVYNGESSLSRALDSLLAQTHKDFELIISDNASTDNTAVICREYAAQYPRIRYIRQPSNRGPTPNFKFVLSESQSPFFMWAAHDDSWQPDYLADNLAALQADPELVCSVSRVEFTDPDGRPNDMDGGTRPLLGTPQENLLSYLRYPAGNSRFYGLFRTDVLKASIRGTDTYAAADWVVMARTLRFGKHGQLDACLFSRKSRGSSSNWAKRNFDFEPRPVPGRQARTQQHHPS